MSTTQFAASAEKLHSVSSVCQRGSHNGCFGPKAGRVCDKTGPGAFWLSTRLLGLALALLMASFSARAQLVFVETEKGEVAAARDAQSGKWGLINRKGEWKLKPAYPELEWDQDRNGFVYQDNTGAEKRLAF